MGPAYIYYSRRLSFFSPPGPANQEPTIRELYSQVTRWLLSRTRDVFLPCKCPLALEAGLMTVWREAKRAQDALPVTIDDHQAEDEQPYVFLR